MALLTRSSYEECIEEEDPNDPEGADSIAYWRDYFDPDVLAGLLDPVLSPPAGIRRYTGDVGCYDLLLVPATNGYELPVLAPGLLHPPNWFGAAWHPDLYVWPTTWRSCVTGGSGTGRRSTTSAVASN